MGNSVGVRLNVSEEIHVVIDSDNLGENLTITGVIYSTEFAPDCCDETLLKSAYIELLSIKN